MTVPKKLTKYINSKQLQYSHIFHSPAYRAEDVAHAIHCPKHKLAKVLAIHVDRKKYLAVIPACDRLDIKKIKEELNAAQIRMFSETELLLHFNDCEIGSNPVFGELYGIDTIVSTSLLEDSEIFFNAGTHTDVMKCSLEDFIEIEKPIIANISTIHRDNFVCKDLGY